MHLEELRFSVVIPTCDRGAFLVEAIESVLAQTLLPMEIIVVDNGREAVDRSALPSTEHLRLVRAVPRMGVAQARNLGAVLATGTHLAFLDDDDSWDAGYLLGVAESFVASGSGVVLGAFCINGEVVIEKSAAIETQQSFMDELLVRNPGATGSVICCTRAAFFGGSGFDPLLSSGEDRALVLDLMRQGIQVTRASTAFMRFRVDNGGPRLSSPGKVLRGKWLFLKKYWKIMSWRLRYVAVKRLVKLYGQCVVANARHG